MQRLCYLAIGHICVLLGIIGLLVPGIPGVVFFLGAAWAYGRSSERLRQRLLHHPLIGRHIVAWEKHRVVPVKAKILAGLMMSVSFGFTLWRAENWIIPTFAGGCMAIVMLYLLSKPSKVPRKD